MVLKIWLVQATQAKAGRGGFTERGVRDSFFFLFSLSDLYLFCFHRWGDLLRVHGLIS